jgi:hypothetical protein
MRLHAGITKAIDTLRMWNIYCLTMATMVMQMHPNLTLYVHCLSCEVNGYMADLDLWCFKNSSRTSISLSNESLSYESIICLSVTSV